MSAVPPPLPLETRGLSDRTVEVLKLGPAAWYADHLAHRTDCWCAPAGPDKTCDQGESLWRLRPGGGGRT